MNSDSFLRAGRSLACTELAAATLISYADRRVWMSIPSTPEWLGWISPRWQDGWTRRRSWPVMLVLGVVLGGLFQYGVAQPRPSLPAPPSSSSEKSDARNEQSGTQVVVLGTGTPLADPERSGPSVAIVVNGSAYLVDCGPGVVRRAAAAEKNGIKALAVDRLKIVFITHLHSDHTLGYPDLIYSPWVLDRAEPLDTYGPPGLKKMTDHIQKAWAEDVRLRLSGLEEANRTGYKVNVHEIKLRPPQRGRDVPATAGGSPALLEIYRDANVTVSAFPVKHGSWKYAYGYRFDTKDRRIVISGDTAPSDEVVRACDGCDVLLHEVFNPLRKKIVDNKTKQQYFKEFHTSPEELGEIARRARPKLLVLYHQVMGERPEEELIEQVRGHYSGAFVSAKDLGVY